VAKWHPQPGCQLAFSSSRSPSAAKSPQLLLGYWPKGKGPASRQQTSAQLIAYFSGQQVKRRNDCNPVGVIAVCLTRIFICSRRCLIPTCQYYTNSFLNGFLEMLIRCIIP